MMKALIVDDESHVIDAIFLLVPWAKLGIDQCLIAKNVPYAKQLIQEEQPEIAIVDVIIGDALGMEILQFIRDKGYKTKVIIISGHDDFKYVHSMFMLGGIEYLLKPIEPDAIIHAVKSAVELVEKDAGRSREEKDGMPDYQYMLLRKILRREDEENAYERLCKANVAIAGSTQCMVLLGDKFFMPMDREEYRIQLREVVGTLREKLEIQEMGTVFWDERTDENLFIFLYANFENAKNMIYEVCRDFYPRKCGQITLGCSKLVRFPQETELAIEQAKIASGFVHEMSSMFQEYRIDMRTPAVKEKERQEKLVEINKAILTQRMDSIEKTLNQWIWSCCIGKWRRLDLKYVWEAFWKLFDRCYQYEKVKKYMGARPGFLDFYVLEPVRTVETMEQYFRSLLETCEKARNTDTDSEDVIRRIQAYLLLDYQSKFVQSDYAEMFHISKEYMSRAFTKKYGKGMVAYLNTYRNQKAQELLRTTDAQIVDIGEQVGFSNPKYFLKQFKKDTGLTPAEYRKQFMK